MDLENKTPTPEEEKDKDNKPEAEAEQTEPKTEDAPASDDKQADENGEGAAAEPEQAEQPAEEAPAEEAAQAAEETAEDTPEEAPDTSAELEQLRAENARLKAQLEAHGAGFKSEYIEDAVLIADNAAKRDGTTITEALQAVAKKYPEWKHTADDKGKGGFKVGAEAPKEDKAADDESLDRAFGIRRKK